MALAEPDGEFHGLEGAATGDRAALLAELVLGAVPHLLAHDPRHTRGGQRCEGVGRLP
ncbi:hypothetical protein SALBM311S_10171 [Streptomyces alboniger]